jgi:hypothetical protein
MYFGDGMQRLGTLTPMLWRGSEEGPGKRRAQLEIENHALHIISKDTGHDLIYGFLHVSDVTENSQPSLRGLPG